MAKAGTSKNTIDIYHRNFIKGVRAMMAALDMETLKDASVHLGISYQTLYKVVGKANKPTVEHGIILCKKCGYSANWLFMNLGAMDLDIQETMDGLRDLLSNLKDGNTKIVTKLTQLEAMATAQEKRKTA